MNMLSGENGILEAELRAMVEKKVRDHDMLSWICPKVREDIVEWIEGNIDLARDRSSRSDSFVDLAKTPYGYDVVRAWEKRTVREMVVTAPPQTGKSVLSWIWPSLWAMDCDPGPMLTVYQNLPVALKTNRLRIEPLMGGIPKLAKQLDGQYSNTTDQYDFADMYWNFQGAGSPITSIPFRRCIADEYEYWRMANDISKAKGPGDEGNSETKFVNNIIALRDRINTFQAISLIVYCCTPQTAGGPSDDLIEGSSGGQWQMVCLQCGQLIPSHQFDAVRVGNELFGGLQGDDSGDIKYVCTNPECRHEHAEEVREDMNAISNGARYEHERPELVETHPSFQWSKLAAPLAPWKEVLSQRKAAGNSNSLGVKQHFENTVRGLTFQIAELSGKYLEQLAKHCKALPDADVIDEIYFSADTQDDGRYRMAVAFDDLENAYVLDYGFCPDDDGMDEAWEWDYDDILFTCGCVDEGGHGTRPRDTKRWVARRRGCLCYKGDARVSKTVDRMWKLSTVVVDGREFKQKRILAVAKHYQKELLFRLHSADMEADNCNVFFPPDASDDLLEQMAALRPDPKSKYGAQLENWVNNGRDDHYFDCLKQALVLRDARLHQRAKDKRKGSRVRHRN